MIEEVLHRRGGAIVRRLRLEPGEATRWHRDPYHRVTVVISGDLLIIEFRKGEALHVPVTVGQTDWEEPGDRAHRAVNAGIGTYEEVTVFFVSDPDAIVQPDEP